MGASGSGRSSGSKLVRLGLAGLLEADGRLEIGG